MPVDPTTVPVSLEASCLFDRLNVLELSFVLQQPLTINHPIALRQLSLTVTQLPNTAPLTICLSESLVVEQSIRIDACKSLVRLGDQNTTTLKLFKSERGDFSLKSFSFEMPYGALMGSKVFLETESEMVLGTIKESHQISHVKATDLFLNTKTRLITHHCHFELAGNFCLKALSDWEDIGGVHFIAGDTFLETPRNKHFIKTKTIEYAQNAYNGNSFIYEQSGGRTVATLADSNAPLMIANALEASGVTEFLGGPLYAKIFVGTPPVTTNFIEIYKNVTPILFGHKKRKNATWHNHYREWTGKTFLSQFGTENTTFSQQDLVLPEVVRGGCLSLTDFEQCLIGVSAANSLAFSLKPWSPVIDILDYARPDSSLQEDLGNNASILVDVLESVETEVAADVPKIVFNAAGLLIQSIAKPLYPTAIEQKLIATAFIQNIGYLPLNDVGESLYLNELSRWLKQNTIEWLDQLPISSQDSASMPSQDLVTFNQRSFRYPEKPILVYVETPYCAITGEIIPSLSPKLILPRSYQSFALGQGPSVKLRQLTVTGLSNSQLTIHHPVYGSESIHIVVDSLNLETKPVVLSQTIEQTHIQRHFLKKKKTTTTQTVYCLSVQTLASIHSEEKLSIHAKQLKQIGSVIRCGSQPLDLQVEQHLVRPVFEASIAHYAAKKRTLLHSHALSGSLLQHKPVMSKIIANQGMVGHFNHGDYTALYLEAGNHSATLCFKESLSLKPVTYSNQQAPQILKRGQVLQIRERVIEEACPSTLLAPQASIHVEVDGLYKSTATQYQAKQNIVLKAKQVIERPLVLKTKQTTRSAGFKVNTYGLQGLTFIESVDVLSQETAYVSHVITGSISIQATTQDIEITGALFKAPQVSLKAEQGTIALTGAPLQREVKQQSLSLTTSLNWLSLTPQISLEMEQLYEHARVLKPVSFEHLNTLELCANQIVLADGLEINIERLDISANTLIIRDGLSTLIGKRRSFEIDQNCNIRLNQEACTQQTVQKTIIQAKNTSLKIKENIVTVSGSASNTHHSDSFMIPIGYLLALMNRRQKRSDHSNDNYTEILRTETEEHLDFHGDSKHLVIKNAKKIEPLPVLQSSMVHDRSVTATVQKPSLKQIIDSFFAQAHRLIEQADMGREELYQKYPALRREALEHRAAIERFKRFVPRDVADLGLKSSVLVSTVAAPVAGRAAASGLHWVYKTARINYQLRTFESRADVTHIFSRTSGGRVKYGHLPDTKANRRLLVETLDRQYFAGVDSYGKQWWHRTLPDQKECWVVMQQGRIKSGGVNEVPKVRLLLRN